MDRSGATPGQNETKGSPPAGESLLPLALAALAPAAAPTVPDYELLRRIGKGAYGEVWLARSKATGVLRAAKIVWRHTFEDERPFKREFEGIQHFEQLSREHPSQLALFHIGHNETEGYFYYVMELADNLGTEADYNPHTLRADFQNSRLPAERVIEIGLALTEALGHLHRNGLVHRDVKPSNVIFVNGRSKLADIGLVTDASDQCSIVGTEGYLPPEDPGTPQADIFALGKVLYEAATGMDRREFPKLPDDLRTWPDAKQVFELNEIILKACAQDSRQRYRTCGELHDELELLGHGKSVKQKRTRQQRWERGKGIALVSSLLIVIAVVISFLPRESRRIAANTLCDKAMAVVRNDDYTNFAEAYMNFKEAITLDPNFAHPYVGLLELSRCEPSPGVPPFTADDFRNIAQHLNQLAPHSAATCCAQSIVNWNEWHYPEAVRDAQTAIKADPNYEFGHTWYAWLLLRFGWPEEASEQMKISESLTPNKAVIYRTFGDIYYAERNFTNAIAQYQIAMQWPSHSIIARREIGWAIGWAYEAMDDYTNALNSFEQANGPDPALWDALARGGISGYWQQLWERTKNNTNTDFYFKGVIQIHLGNTNAALDWLQKSFETHEQSGVGIVSQMDVAGPMGELLFYEQWDGLHDDPGFKRLLDKIGFTKVMPPPKK
jgi:serine/threonine protein kinase